VEILAGIARMSEPCVAQGCDQLAYSLKNLMRASNNSSSL
jgi:hypothetical protein